MTRGLLIVLLLVSPVLGVSRLAAHDNYRVIGIITKIEGKELSVKTKAGKTFSIDMNDRTLVKRDKTKVSASELKRGLSVVVDARGDSEFDLEAVEVRIVPVIAAPARKK